MSTIIEINRSLAGSRRNRKNAVDLSLNFEQITDKSPQVSKGRPSKGGEKIRAKRYYVKNHLLVLHKRKLKRYYDKVIKLLCKHIYNEEEVLNELRKKCTSYIAKYPGTKEFHLIYYANIVREDRYLNFMEEASNTFLDSYNEEIPSIEIMQPLERNITTKHSLMLLHMCTLLSAYLLLHHVNEEFKEMPSGPEKEEKVRQACTDEYIVSYDHLVDLYKDSAEVSTEDEFETVKRIFPIVQDAEEEENEKTIIVETTAEIEDESNAEMDEDQRLDETNKHRVFNYLLATSENDDYQSDDASAQVDIEPTITESAQREKSVSKIDTEEVDLADKSMDESNNLLDAKNERIEQAVSNTNFATSASADVMKLTPKKGSKRKAKADTAKGSKKSRS
ncbi:hypothetical protein BDF20DRAFT_370788 [Mycotypha africana]|uniref:uncharacterized protein n=1 Tax=Mycotypha africana TaxID=64632 RepID=UPI0023003280|nr:uncharacterized protein BDF20DRAFT_370788 [Mycotypha africana]KAI8984190.1 hypothetical protein BDF20DRAFT_370788 [Mycotypha africana]